MIGLERLPQQQRRIIAWAVLAGLIIVVWSVVIEPLVTAHGDAGARLAQAQLQLQRLERAIGDAEAQLKADTLSDRGTGAPDIWQGENTTLVSASLQQLVQSVSAQSGLTLVSVAEEDRRKVGDVPAVGIVVEAFGDMTAFVDLLLALETHRPIVLVDDLLIRRYQRPAGPLIGDRLPLSARFSIFAPVAPEVGTDSANTASSSTAGIGAPR
ncbi:type II secretion system protein GspM [Pannonibacter tanglangensis]|uniref:General secretion pathway protein M n=1 Tax=Pannonibacter tanglangensis TaxID=2750084 RepID=A0ABW9ZLZ9_9HYPH|nr:type II secretion system protein GspM [Pannonibacter sp. XCT-34]NBN65944.1 hypothetical protein [Pannonibacter sp. XCT-34]